MSGYGQSGKGKLSDEQLAEQFNEFSPKDQADVCANTLGSYASIRASEHYVFLPGLIPEDWLRLSGDNFNLFREYYNKHALNRDVEDKAQFSVVEILRSTNFFKPTVFSKCLRQAIEEKIIELSNRLRARRAQSRHLASGPAEGGSLGAGLRTDGEPPAGAGFPSLRETADRTQAVRILSDLTQLTSRPLKAFTHMTVNKYDVSALNQFFSMLAAGITQFTNFHPENEKFVKLNMMALGQKISMDKATFNYQSYPKWLVDNADKATLMSLVRHSREFPQNLVSPKNLTLLKLAYQYRALSDAELNEHFMKAMDGSVGNLETNLPRIELKRIVNEIMSRHKGRWGTILAMEYLLNPNNSAQTNCSAFHRNVYTDFADKLGLAVEGGSITYALDQAMAEPSAPLYGTLSPELATTPPPPATAPSEAAVTDVSVAAQVDLRSSENSEADSLTSPLADVDADEPPAVTNKSEEVVTALMVPDPYNNPPASTSVESVLPEVSTTPFTDASQASLPEATAAAEGVSGDAESDYSVDDLNGEEYRAPTHSPVRDDQTNRSALLVARLQREAEQARADVTAEGTETRTPAS